MRAACGVRRGAPPVDGAHLLHVGKRRRPLSGYERGISASTPCWVCSPSRHFARVRCFGLPRRFGPRGRSPLRRRARWLSPLCTPASMSSTSCSLRVEVGSRSMSVLIPQARLWQSPSRWLWCACGKGAAFSAVLRRFRHRCDMLLSVHFSNCCFPKARIS